MRGATHFVASHIRFLALFQSTRPMRGATAYFDEKPVSQLYFNPRAPCGARPGRRTMPPRHSRFQSTRPMRGATNACRTLHKATERFQSTRPMRGATIQPNFERSTFYISIHAPHAGRDLDELQLSRDPGISIHAPHAGRDCSHSCPASPLRYFNPRAPCGARRRRQRS